MCSNFNRRNAAQSAFIIKRLQVASHKNGHKTGRENQFKRFKQGQNVINNVK